MKTYTFDQLKGRSRNQAFKAARTYIRDQYHRYGTDEWAPVSENIIEEARRFIYTKDGEAYGEIKEDKQC